MSETYNLDAKTRLAEDLDTSETEVDVVDGSVFPSSGTFRIKINKEVMKVTSRSSNTLTVIRASDDTTARQHPINAEVRQVLNDDALIGLFDNEASESSGFVRLVSGDITLPTSSWTEVSSSLRITLNARVGDLIEYGISMFVSCGSGTTNVFDAATIVSGSVTNKFANATDGVLGWYSTPSDGANTKSGSVWYLVQAGDIVAGQVTLSLVTGRVAGSNPSSVSASSGDPLIVFAKNHSIRLAAPGGLYTDYIHIRDEKAQNTSGGTFTSGAWRTRDLNTEVSDTGGLATLSSNQITLQPGTYRCLISAPAYSVDRHQARLYNITDSTVTLLGTSEFSQAITTNPDHSTNKSIITGRFTLTSAKVIEVQHRCQTTYATYGFGIMSNLSTEIYTIAEFWREGSATEGNTTFYEGALNLSTELHNAPPSIEGADNTNPEWWEVSSNATLTEVDIAGESITEIAERCHKVVTTLSAKYSYDKMTYADEPRVKSGRSVCAHFLVWSVSAAPARIRIQSSVGSLGVSRDTVAAGWTQLDVGPVTLDGTYVEVRCEVDSGTAYFLPCDENGKTIQNRNLRFVHKDITTVKTLTGISDEATWTDVDITSTTSNLAAIAELTAFISEGDSGNVYELHIRRNGSSLSSSNSTVWALTRNSTWAFQGLSARSVLLDDGQIFEYYLDRQSGATALDFGEINCYGYWEWE